jgi:hypothetical protein
MRGIVEAYGYCHDRVVRFSRPFPARPFVVAEPCTRSQAQYCRCATTERWSDPGSGVFVALTGQNPRTST